MARQWRIEYERALYPVLARGKEGRPIVTDDKDRAAFLEILGRMAARFEVEVLAYVLMNNHYHLLLIERDKDFRKRYQQIKAQIKM